MSIRTRKDAWTLPAWDPIFIWYARGILAMQKRGIAKSNSWRYQAAIHDYVPERDPYRSRGDVLPEQDEQNRFWKQCQHFSWFFLPWHRMYLGHFEQMILSIVIEMKGPADWALPYWNYSDASNPNARRLPKAFVDRQMPDGTPNPLRVEFRGAGNDSDLVGDETDVDIEGCLREPEFEAGPFGGPPGFGGPKTGFKHSRRPGEPARIGSLESTPHGTMHGAVGGPSGWMSFFETAALDPIFWLHHCNIDRLWEVWLQRPGNKPIQFTNPTNSAWTTAIPFELHDAKGNPLSMTPSQVLDPAKSMFAYQYDNISDPLAPVPPPSLEETARSILEGMGTRIPEMVGATKTGITLRGRRATTSLSTSLPTGPASVLESMGEPARIILNIENITAARRTAGYAVYVNLPEGVDADDFRDLFAGNLPLFGIDAPENPNDPHGSDGLNYALDISKVVRVLQSRGDWDPNDIRLTFVPKTAPGELMESLGVESPVRVGRVSLYST